MTCMTLEHVERIHGNSQVMTSPLFTRLATNRPMHNCACAISSSRRGRACTRACSTFSVSNPVKVPLTMHQSTRVRTPLHVQQIDNDPRKRWISCKRICLYSAQMNKRDSESASVSVMSCMSDRPWSCLHSAAYVNGRYQYNTLIWGTTENYNSLIWALSVKHDQKQTDKITVIQVWTICRRLDVLTWMRRCFSLDQTCLVMQWLSQYSQNQ